MTAVAYSRAVDDSRAYLSISLDLAEPVELADFARHFGSLAAQFDGFLKETRPDLHGDAHIYVKEVRKGSIIADLVPLMAGLVDLMDKAIIIEQFSKLITERIKTYIGGGKLEGANKAQLQMIENVVAAVANNTSGQAKISTIRVVNGRDVVAAEMTFDTADARNAVTAIEAHKVELDKRENVDHENVLMVFHQANLKPAEIGEKHGEQVIIERISPAPKPLVYASDLAKERIKAEFGDAIFRLGFMVDVNVESHKGKIAAYKVTNVRQIIPLPDDETP